MEILLMIFCGLGYLIVGSKINIIGFAIGLIILIWNLSGRSKRVNLDQSHFNTNKMVVILFVLILVLVINFLKIFK